MTEPPLTALVLGGAALMTAAPAQAQYRYYDGYRPRVERRIIERRVVRPDFGRPWYSRRFYGRDCRVVVTRRINRCEAADLRLMCNIGNRTNGPGNGAVSIRRPREAVPVHGLHERVCRSRSVR
jgi:hypothetical protein